MPRTTLPNLPDKFSFSPEFRLVAACSWIAPPDLEQDQAEKVSSLCRAGKIDWEVFITLVRRHGIPALAHTNLGRYAGDSLPYEVREVLRKLNSSSRCQSLFQHAELVRLIRLFAGSGMDLIPLKGVFLSHRLYGESGMRASADLDILVEMKQINHAEQLLVAEGYCLDNYSPNLTVRQKEHIKTRTHHFDFIHPKSGLHVELHWNFGMWPQEQMSEIILHTMLRNWEGASVKCLDDDATLLMLCYHGSLHEWFSLKWLGDVGRLILSERSTGWENLFVLAREFDLQRIVAHSALLVHWIYGIDLPPELCTLIREENLAATLSERALKSLLMSSGELKDSGKHAQKMQAVLNMKRLRPSLPYSLVLKSCLIPVEDFHVLPLPSSFFWLYYPLRPILWFWRHYIHDKMI